MLKRLTLLIIGFLLLVGCSKDTADDLLTGDSAEQPEELTIQEESGELALMSHDSFSISEEVITKFESENNVRISILPAGDAGSALNQAILSKDDPLADLFFGVDNTFMSRALNADIFEPYESPMLGQIYENLKLDPEHRLTPVDFGDVCLNYDRAWFEERSLALPTSLSDLTSPSYEQLLVVENPATSSPGLAFLLATIAEFGTTGDYTYLDYWQELKTNGVLVTDGWEQAYFGNFSAVSDGDRPLVVSYASSPPAEIVFADPPIDEAPTGSITSPGTCFRQIEFVGILRGTENRAHAEAFIDYMIGETFQEDIPLNMFVFPANRNADLPPVFDMWASIPDEPATINSDEIDAYREEWIREWTEVVLR